MTNDPIKRPPLSTEWGLTLAVFLLALAIYGGSAALLSGFETPNVAYFPQLADAFSHGRLYLVDLPAEADLTQYQGRWFVPFLPLPAVMLLPWVALAGVASVNTVAFSVCCGAISVAVVWRILLGLSRFDWIAIRRSDRVWLTVLFAIGCVHWHVVLPGSVWFVSQTCTVLFVTLTVWAALAGRSAWVVGTLLAIALWARPNVIFTWPLLLGIVAQQLSDSGVQPVRSKLLAWSWRSAVPLAISICGLMVYNQARFDDPFDFGYARQSVNAEIAGDLARGQFHPYHVPRNLHTLLFGLPKWRAGEVLPRPDADGMSLFLTTPALINLWRVRRRREPLVRWAWIATGLLLIPLLLYYNTGWQQIGYRFSLDFMVPLIVLLAVAVSGRMTWPMRVLICTGVAVVAWGNFCWFAGRMA